MIKTIRESIVISTLTHAVLYNESFILYYSEKDNEAEEMYTIYSAEHIKEDYKNVEEEVKNIFKNKTVYGCTSYKRSMKNIINTKMKRFCNYCLGHESIASLSSADVSIESDVISLSTPYGLNEDIEIICCPVCGRELI